LAATPRAARSHHIEDSVDDLAHRPSARSTRAIRRRQVRHDHEPFLIRHIGLVSARLANMLLSGGWGPHGDSGVGLSNPWNHIRLRHSTPFETASKISFPGSRHCCRLIREASLGSMIGGISAASSGIGRRAASASPDRQFGSEGAPLCIWRQRGR